MRYVKRNERVCFRTSAATTARLEELASLLELPRSAVVFLLVERALAHMDYKSNPSDVLAVNEWLKALDPAVLAAAQRQGVGE